MRGMASSVVAHAPPRCEARSAPSQSPKRAQLRGAQRGADASQHASQRFTARSTLSAQDHGHALLSVTALYSITLCTASRHALHNTRSKLTAPSVPRYDPRRRARHDAQHSEWRRQHGMARSTGSARAARSAHAQYGVARARQHSAQQHAQHAAARGTTLSSVNGAWQHGCGTRSTARSARHAPRAATHAQPPSEPVQSTR